MPESPDVNNLTTMEQNIIMHMAIWFIDKPSHVAKWTGHDRHTVSGKLTEFAERGLVWKQDDGIYRITNDGFELGVQLLRTGLHPYTD